VMELGLGHSGRIQAIAWRRDGSALATASGDGRAILWDPKSGGPWATLGLDGGWPTYVNWSPDGRTVATLDESQSGRYTVTLWDARRRAPRARLADPVGSIGPVYWSPDGTRLAVGEPGGIGIWDPRTARRLRLLPGAYPP